MTAPSSHDQLFVDEAGDLTLFDKAGRNIVGTPGVSNDFMVGVVQLPDPERVGRELAQLRADLPSDPWFAGVPSMDPEQRKTAHFFHAKDDVPEVRREVFGLLRTFGVTARIAIRRKQALAAEAPDFFRRDRKLRPDDVYGDWVRRLFEWRWRQDSVVDFARRVYKQSCAGATAAVPTSVDTPPPTPA